MYLFGGFNKRLTCLVGGDVDGRGLRGVRALGGDAVGRLDLEAVLRVRLQVADGDAALREAEVVRGDVHVVVAARAAAALRVALLADDVIEHVLAAAGVPGLAPLQDQRRLVHTRDDAPRGRWDRCGGTHTDDE